MVGQPATDRTTAEILDLFDAYRRGMQTTAVRAWLGLNLTVPQLKVLQVLVSDGPQAPSLLAQKLDISPSTVTGLCDRLVDRGLVMREADPRDRRANRVVATEDGQRLIADLNATRREQFGRLVDAMSDEERRLLAGALRALLRAAESTL